MAGSNWLFKPENPIDFGSIYNFNINEKFKFHAQKS